MKKIIFSVLAVAALASCMKEQVVETQQSSAIKFADSFVENATRSDANPVIDNDNIEKMYVWGIVKNEAGIVFDDETVTKNGSEWTYGETQYWTPGNNYWFSAIVGDRTNDQIAIDFAADGFDGMSEKGLGTVTFTNTSGVNDVLYAEYATVSPTSLDVVPDPVKFQFQHLLSKVQFTFKNGFQNYNNTVVVTGIEMDVPGVGVIDLTQDKLAWTDLDNETTLDMGNMGNSARLPINEKATSDNVRFTIPAPASQTYDIRFHVALYMGDVLAYETDMTSAVTGVALEMGKAYNFTATIDQNSLDLHKIEFNVGVTDWADYIDVKHPVIATYNDVAYYSLQEAVDAATGDATVYLISDVKENVTITQKEGVNLVIEGNDKKYDGVITINGNARSKGAETLTIQNVHFETIHNVDTKESEWTFIVAPSKIDGKYNYSHNVTIQGCTFKNLVDGILRVGSANFTGAYNIVMKDCKATNMHSLFQAQSIDNTVKVENVEVVASKNGVSFGNTFNAILSNAKINAIEYGVRADGNRNGSSLTAEKVNISAKQPIIVRKNTTPYTVTLVGTENTLTPADYYHVVFTTGNDDAAYVAPAAANCSISGADNLLVYPRNARVATAEAFKAAVANDSNEIILEPGAVIDITDEIVYIKKAVTISSEAGNKTTLKGKFVAEGDINVSNVKFVANAKSNAALEGGTYGTYATGSYSSIVTIHKSAANFQNCEFDGGDNYVPALNYFMEADGKILNVTASKFTKTYIYSKVLCNITNNEFNLQDCPYPICVWPRATGNGSCVFTGNSITSNYSGDKAFCQLYFLSQSVPYANVEINVNNNGNFLYAFGLANSAKFATDGSVVFAPGSKSFTINPETGRP